MIHQWRGGVGVRRLAFCPTLANLSCSGALMGEAKMIARWMLLALAMFALPVEAKVVGEEVEYRAGETTLKGYLAYDDSVKGARPGILVVHEWWGQNAYARKRARMLAALGYTALALDMYGEGRQATHPEEAGKFAGEIRNHMALAEARFRAALALLQQQPTVDPAQIGAIGYCFGGGIVLEMARRGLPLKAVASFHGSLATGHPATPGSIKGRLFIANGADDPLTTPEQITAFKQEMANAGVDYSFVNYPGARHSFTNPDADRLAAKYHLPLGYNAAADKESWAQMRRMFRQVFGR
jgi:dienelactone hydrolase